jgi:hypothetical protein
MRIQESHAWRFLACPCVASVERVALVAVVGEGVVMSPTCGGSDSLPFR